MVQPKRRAAFTLMELVIAMVVMAAGLMAIQALMVRQSRQVSHIEARCQAGPTYYAVSQTEEMMQALGAPADLQNQVGQAAWTPTVSARTQYGVTLISAIRSSDGQQMTAVVTLGSK